MDEGRGFTLKMYILVSPALLMLKEENIKKGLWASCSRGDLGSQRAKAVVYSVGHLLARGILGWTHAGLHLEVSPN